MNHRTTIWLVHETTGPHVAGGFVSDEDAKNFLNHEIAAGRLLNGHYSIKSIEVEDFGKRG